MSDHDASSDSATSPLPGQTAASGRETTRQSLLEAGLRLFGMKGYDGASVRDIAAEARTNIAAIGYHFGGKEGLRRACAEHVAATIRSVASVVLEGKEHRGKPGSKAASRQKLDDFVCRAVSFMLTDARSRMMMHFMLREMANPSVAFGIVYHGVVEPTHRRLCVLFAGVTGEDPESEAVRLAVFSIVGQVFYFRFGQQIVLRRMDWPAYGEREAAAIAQVVLASLDAALARHASATPEALMPKGERP